MIVHAMPNNKKGYRPFALAVRDKIGKRTAAEFAEQFDLSTSTVWKVTAAVIRPGLPMMQSLLAAYPDLYDLGIESYFGRRPRGIMSAPSGERDPIKAFGRAVRELRGDRTVTQYAAFLEVSYLTVYTTTVGKPPPGLSLTIRIVAKLPELYDLGAALHFGPRPDVKMAKARRS